MAQTATRNRRIAPALLMATAAIAGGIGVTALGLPIQNAAFAAPGDEHPIDFPLASEDGAIPASNAASGGSSFDALAHGLTAGQDLGGGTGAGAFFTISVNSDGTGVNYQVLDIEGLVAATDYSGSYTRTVTMPDEEVLVMVFTWAYDAPEEEPEPEFEVAGLNGRSPGSDGAYCSPGDLSIPLTGAEEGVVYGGEVDLPYGTATLSEDGSALIIEGYDPAARAGTGLATTPSIVTVFESEAFTATDGESTDEDVFVSVGLGTWCGQDITVTSTDDGATWQIDLTALFDSITTPGEFVRPAEWILSGLPTPDLGELVAYDADGNVVEFFGGPGEPTVAGMATTLVFTPADGADVTEFSLSVSRQDGAKGVVPAPVSISLAPVEVPEQPTEPETPETPDEPETPEQPETPDEPEAHTTEVPRVSE